MSDTKADSTQPQEQSNTDAVTTSNYIFDAAAVPDFRSGDTVRVHYRIKEGEKTRVQPYEGIVISKRGSGISKTFMVRKIGADKIGVERIFPLYSPNIEKLEVLKKAKVRRSKLYYLRDKKGRAAVRLKERLPKPVKKTESKVEEMTKDVVKAKVAPKKTAKAKEVDTTKATSKSE